MARIRTIKPEFFTSEDIVGLKPVARLLYIALWCEADKEGRLIWKPRTFKLRYFPGDSIDIDACARELLASRLVVLYGDGLAYIPSFRKHQHINPRETESSLPDHANCTEIDACARVATRQDASIPGMHAQGGREGKGREGNTNDASFDAFWSEYPRKDGKASAQKAWAKLRPDADLHAKVLTAVEMQRRSEQWTRDGGQYIPHASTWLNGRRWEDQPVALPFEAPTRSAKEEWL